MSTEHKRNIENSMDPSAPVYSTETEQSKLIILFYSELIDSL